MRRSCLRRDWALAAPPFPQEVFYRLDPARVAEILRPQVSARGDTRPARTSAASTPCFCPPHRSSPSAAFPSQQLPFLAKEISLDVFPKWAVLFAEGRVAAGALPGHVRALVEAFEERFLAGFTRALQDNVRAALVPPAPLPRPPHRTARLRKRATRLKLPGLSSVRARVVLPSAVPR